MTALERHPSVDNHNNLEMIGDKLVLLTSWKSHIVSDRCIVILYCVFLF